MKTLLFVMTLMTSMSSFADLHQGVEIGCIARLYCAPIDYKEIEKVFIGQLSLYGDSAEIDNQCEKVIFSKYRGDSTYTAARIDDLVADFPGLLCFEPRISEIKAAF